MLKLNHRADFTEGGGARLTPKTSFHGHCGKFYAAEPPHYNVSLSGTLKNQKGNAGWKIIAFRSDSIRGALKKCRLGIFTQQKNFLNRAAFTLAEVLITIGVIGVVAAMTLPTLINKYKIAVLQTQFKKSYSVMQQVIVKAKAEAGIENFGKYCVSYDGTNYTNQEECYQYLYKALINTNHKSRHDKDEYYIERNDQIYNLIGNPVNQNATQFLYTNRRFNDTSYADFFILGGKVNVYVDTNGSAPPNRIGYDIFYFYVDTKDALAGQKMTKKYTEEELEDMKNNAEPGKEWQYDNAGWPCSFTSTQGSNGSGCAYFAIIDVNPDTGKTGYWKSLK